MRLPISGVLDAARLKELRRILAGGQYVDGRRTAGATARLVKDNQQLDPASPPYRQASTLVLEALHANEAFQAAALPRAFSGLLFARYGTGMSYGAHVDNAVMRSPDLRTDLAFTVFLSEPSEYDGGELVLMDAEGDNAVKLQAGAAYLYPASALHRVQTVSRGQRDVCVGWIQSLVRDARIREMIFDLARARAQIADQPALQEARELLARTQTNLLRLHAET